MVLKYLFPSCTVLTAVFLLSGCATTPADETAFGPWDAFTYIRHEGAMIRREEGRFDSLNQCLNWVTLRVKRNSASYHCGFRCKEGADRVVRCEKTMGYPN